MCKNLVADNEGSFKFAPKEVADLADRTGSTYGDAFDILVNFVSKYEGERPAVVEQVPAVIYNGIWYNTIEEFFAGVDVTPEGVEDYKKEYNITSGMETIQLMIGHNPNTPYEMPQAELQVYLEKNYPTYTLPTNQ